MDAKGPSSAVPADRPRSAGASWLFLGLLLAACGGAEPPLQVVNAAGSPSAAWLEDPNLGARTRTVARIAADRWGGADLDGWTVRFVARIEACGSATSSGLEIVGCTRPRWRTIDVRVDPGSPCVENTALLHEIGHVALPDDPGHLDPRWMSAPFWSALLADVERAIGAGDATCAEDVAAWRLWWGTADGLVHPG